MKLVIQIPCYNEEECLPVTLKEIPLSFPGIDELEILIIDDGSIDKTVEVAKKSGIKHIISNVRNLGLSKTFNKGLQKSLELGADIIVNLDADNQYYAKDIEKIIKPIIENKADIVIGARSIENIKYFSFPKKIMQKFGSFLIKLVSNQDINDASSGFRALSREAALRTNIFSNFTYTIETIIQASNIGLKILSVPIKVNDARLRDSRLMKSSFLYTQRAVISVIRALIIYKPLKFSSFIALIFFIPGIIFLIRYLYFYILQIFGHIPSIVIALFLITFSLIIVIGGLFSHLISINRRILEDNQYNIRKIILNLNQKGNQ
jgi:glycosyltransferase involved in cell wall biosynthesis